MDYHRDPAPLRLREYGRNVQRMVDLLPSIPDAAQREQMAHEIVRVMAIVAPSTKEVADFRKKLWDHLQQIGNFDLPVESPFGKLDRPEPGRRLPRMAYPTGHPKLRQYGRNIELMIDRAVAMEPGPARDAYIRWIATYMKLALHNRGGAHTEHALIDQMVWDQLFKLSSGELRQPPDSPPLMNAQTIVNRTPISNASAKLYDRKSKKAQQRAKMKEKLKGKKPYGQGSSQGGGPSGHPGGQQGGQRRPFYRDRPGPRPNRPQGSQGGSQGGPRPDAPQG